MFKIFSALDMNDLCKKHLEREKLVCWEGEWVTAGGGEVREAVLWAREVFMPPVGSDLCRRAIAGRGERWRGGESQGRPKRDGGLLLKGEEGS